MINSSKLPDLKRVIQSAILDGTTPYPYKIAFSQGLGLPSFTITIEKDAHDFFIDSEGKKWVRAD